MNQIINSTLNPLDDQSFELSTAFFDGAIPGWESSFNSPHLQYKDDLGECVFSENYDPITQNENLYNCLLGFQLPNGNTYAEGIHTNMNFIEHPSQTYCIDISTNAVLCTPNSPILYPYFLELRAANGLVNSDQGIIYNVNTGGFPVELQGASSQSIGMIEDDNGIPDVTSFTFMPDMDYSQLQMYNAPILGAGNGNGSVSINSVTVSCETSALIDIQTKLVGSGLLFTVENEYPNIPFNEYTWDFGDGNTSTESSPFHDYENFGSYNICVDISNINGCCARLCKDIEYTSPPSSCNVDENTIYIDATCPLTNSFSDLVSLGIYQSGGNISSEKIVIKGDFTLNENFTFSNCEFYFEPGSELIIESPGKIEINNNSILQGCNKMWKGITVNGTFPNNSFWFRGNTIKDAYSAIELKDGCNVLQNSNVFIDNYIGVFSERIFSGPSNSVKQHYGSAILNSRFITEGNMLDPYDGQPAWSQVPYAGVFVNNLDHLIVTDLTLPIINFSLKNSFIGIRNGIIATNTNLTIKNNIIKDLYGRNGDEYLRPEMSGYAIYVSSDYATKISENNISNVYAGIVSQYTYLTEIDIRDNTIYPNNSDGNKQIKYGIYLGNMRNGNVNVSNNLITSSGVPNTVGGGGNSGIKLYKLSNVSFNIISNEITDNGDKYSPFSVTKCNAASNLIGKIEDNNINRPGESFYGGMGFGDSNNLLIKDNHITGLNGHGGGISLSNVSNYQVVDNRIVLDPISYVSYGIKNTASPIGLICCNILENGGVGQNFIGENEPMNYGTNTYNGARYGLVLHDAEIGNQDIKGNSWAHPAYTRAALYSTVDNQAGMAASSVFTVNPLPVSDGALPNRFFPLDIDEIIFEQWFQNVPDPNPTCVSQPTCEEDLFEFNPYDPSPPNNIDPCEKYSKFIDAITGVKLEGYYKDQNNWTRDYFIYLYFSKVPRYLWEDCTVIDDFMSQTGYIPLYVQTELDHLNAFSLSTTQQSTLYQSTISVKEAMDDLEKIYSTTEDEEYINYESEISNLQNIVNVNTNIISSIGDIVKSNSITSLNTLLSDIQSLQSTLAFHDDLKTVRLINTQIDLYGTDNVSSSDIIILREISNKCALEYGQAVFEAQAILEGMGEFISDDLVVVCENNNPKIRSSIETNQFSEVLVYPNPSIGIFTVEFNKEYQEGLSIEIFNNVGMQVYQTEVITENPSFRLDLSAQPAGVYFLKVNAGIQEISHKKIVIIN